MSTKKYWYIGGGILALCILLVSCNGPETPASPVASVPAATGAPSAAPVVVNTPAPSSGSEGFLTGLLAGHVMSNLFSDNRAPVVTRNYYAAPAATPTAPAATTPKPSVPSVSPKPSTSFTGAMRSFSGSSSSFRSSGSSFRSGSFRVR